MAGSEDLIDFDVIETQKENIQSLPGGRSAKALASMFSPALGETPTFTPTDTRNLNDLVRQGFEEEIISISESDDPLDIYDRYVKWTLDAYPSAQATPQSQLLSLLERATKAFLTSSHYKNDPRYLKLWLHYIRFFSDAPRETFAFLARHNIGEGLALFYEEFAAWLEGAGRWIQAEEVYKTGIDREGRPVERLMRKFREFNVRLADRPQNGEEPHSPAIPTVRPVLAAKVDPFATSSSPPMDPQAVRSVSAIGGPSSRPRQKLSIFSDADASSSMKETLDAKTRGWENIDSKGNRKKENVIEARPWAGEVLKAGGKRNTGPKITIFRDESRPHKQSGPLHSNSMSQQQETVNQRTGRAERVFVELAAVYPNPDDASVEMSFEEIRAQRRGWLDKDWSKVRDVQTQSKQAVIHDKLNDGDRRPALQNVLCAPVEQAIKHKTVPLQHEKITSQVDRPKKTRVKEINATQIIRTNLESPTGPKLKRKASTEPTMTFHTRAATDEIYDIFNQALNDVKAGPEEDNTMTTNVYSEDEDDYTSAGESTGTGRISAPLSEAGDLGDIDGEETESKSVSGWSDFTSRKHVPKLDGVANGIDELSVKEPEDGGVVLMHGTQDLGDPDMDDDEDCTNHSAITEILEISEAFSPEALAVRTKFIPIPPEDFEVPTQPFRDAAQTSQNRLPFMTPIVERTEYSIMPTTVHQAKQEYSDARTPCREMKARTPLIAKGAPRGKSNDLWSSPFQEIVNEASPADRHISKPKLVRSKPVSKPVSIGEPFVATKSRKGPIITDPQCNPVDESIRNTILSALSPALENYPGFYDHRPETYDRSIELQKFIKALSKSKPTAERPTSLPSPPVLSFPSATQTYTLKRELGKGAFAPVYLVESTAPLDSDRQSLEAMKTESPATPWEFYILTTTHRRLTQPVAPLASSSASDHFRAITSIILAHELHLFADTHYLLLPYHPHSTLLSLVNLYLNPSPPALPGVMDEALAMFFTIELLRTLSSLHSVGIMHGDLKADNCLARLQAPSEEWTVAYRADGSDGWASKGICLIDFGRGIDMRAFSPTTSFVADWAANEQDCIEMREMRPWRWQADYWGLAGVVHSLLFGKYLETVVIVGGSGGAGGDALGGKRYGLRERIKRYWQGELWETLFTICLNNGKEDGEEGGRKLMEVRLGMEKWLEANSEKGVGVRGALRKVEDRLGATKCRR